MTENKRFIIDEYFEIGSVIIDTENENVRFKHENKLSMEQCCNFLNEQYETIQQLQDENYGLKQTVAQLVKELKETSQKKEKYNIQPYAIFRGGKMMTGKRFTEYNGVIENGGFKMGSDSEIYLPFNTLITVQTDNFELWLDVKELIKKYYVEKLNGVIE